jgi:Protein-tyrosine phosphatase
VKQMHFNSWPDFGCPKDVDQLLDFVQSVRSQMSGLRTNVPGPILVHCRYYRQCIVIDPCACMFLSRISRLLVRSSNENCLLIVFGCAFAIFLCK